MITASISEARRNLGLLIERARKGEEVLIIKDSRPVATIQPVDASDLELATRITDRQARRLIEMTESAPAKTFRSAAAAVRFLKTDVAGKR
ncbi:MAG TPA: type II toxin-antitoxin system prevent-host-death family antitoxin [Bryobacteraceae bacterium]|nr:type II toxin-antitoxin system prevent-host-death family antitoxin [Bryobacteraceae bacterium]